MGEKSSNVVIWVGGGGEICEPEIEISRVEMN